MKKLLIQAFDEPNHTQTPNKFFDMIPDMSEAELRVTLVMIRHTLGYHKSTFKLGMKKLGEESGLTRQGAIAGAEAAERRGIFRRANPDSQKEAEWELVLLPVNVDDMSNRITPDVNVDDTTCKSGLQQVEVKENYKENNKETFFDQPTPDNYPLDWYLSHNLAVPENWKDPSGDAQRNEFERSLGFGKLPWDTGDFEKLSKWVITIYNQDKTAFQRYAEWRTGDGKYNAMNNKQIRMNPKMFIDTGWPTYLAHISMNQSKKSKGFAL